MASQPEASPTPPSLRGHRCIKPSGTVLIYGCMASLLCIRTIRNSDNTHTTTIIFRPLN